MGEGEEMNRQLGVPKVCKECGCLHHEAGKMCEVCEVCPLCGRFSEDAQPHQECCDYEQFAADRNPLGERGE